MFSPPPRFGERVGGGSWHGVAQTPADPRDLRRWDFTLDGVRYRIWLPQRATLMSGSDGFSVSLSQRLAHQLHLRPAPAGSNASYAHVEKLSGGAVLRYNIDRDVGGGSGGGWSSAPGDRVNANALRQITDDTGGRTEIVRGSDGLGPATARIADELSKQYYLGYSSNTERDGQWHSIRVDVKDRRLTVRARRGYIAS